MFLEQTESEKAFSKILRLAATREQSSLKVRKKLEADGYPSQAIDEAMERACTANVINDERYADCLVRSTLAAGKGLRNVVDEIESLGLTLDEIPSYQEHEDQGFDYEVERAVSILERRPPRSKNQREAAFRKLIQQGFDSSVASQAARRWFDSHTNMSTNKVYY